MSRLIRMPFIFFSVAVVIGILLRFHFILPQDWLIYPFWLHAHSHIMFLGWILNFLCIAYVTNFIPSQNQKRYIVLLWIIQVILAGMLISFPLQGYGAASIALSTAHTVAITVFAFWINRIKTSGSFNPALWFAKLSLIFFIVASIGPMLLGPIMANGYAYTKWYYFAVYYYLHFQYNGTFTFGAISLLFFMLQQQGAGFEKKSVKRFGIILFTSVFPTYLLSTLWTKPLLIVNVIGGSGMIVHIIAVILLFRILRPKLVVFEDVSKAVRVLLLFSVSAFIIKTLLQAASAVPVIAHLAYENRNYMIAYLHLVLIGMISSFLLAWSVQHHWIGDLDRGRLILLGFSFTGMELALIIHVPVPDQTLYRQILLLLFSGLIWLAVLLLRFKPVIVRT